MFLKKFFEKNKWKAFLIPYILLRIPALCLFILNNDEFVSFRMLSNLKQYLFLDVRLPFYDYFFVKLYTFIFGFNFFPLRIVNLIIGMFTLYFIFNYFYSILGKKAAYIASVIYVLSPIFVFYNVFTESYNLSIFCITGSIFYTHKFLKDKIDSKERSIFFLLNLIFIFTHYLNIAFMGIYYFFTTIKNRKFLKYFFIFIILTSLPIGLRIYNSFFLESGYGSSELLDPNLRALSVYPYNNVFSIYLYTIIGLKLSLNMYSSIFVLLLFITTLIFLFKNKNTELNTIIFSSFFYFLLLGLISKSLDEKMFSRSFSLDYLTITAIFMIFPIIWIFIKQWKPFIYIVICLFMFSNILLYRETLHINKQYIEFRSFVKKYNPAFIISKNITSESKTKEAIKLFFSDAKVLTTHKRQKKNPGYYVINLRFPKETLNTLDRKTLIYENKRLEKLYDQRKDIKESISDMEYFKEFVIGGNIFVVYKKN